MYNRILIILFIVCSTELTVKAQCSVERVSIFAVLADPNSGTNNFDTDGDGTASTNDDEFVQICNDSSGDVAISGWTLSDAVSVRYTFATPDTIRAGECLTIITDYSGSSPMPAYFRDINNGTAIWNNSGDDIVLSNGAASCTETYTTPTAGCITLLVGTNTDDCSLTPADLGTGPIPVELMYFNAEQKGQMVRLDWATASELNNDFFELQKSNDGFNFSPIAVMEGQGTSTQVSTYSFQDYSNSPSESIYYRLNQVDFDGKSEYSKVLKIKNANAPYVVTKNGNVVNVIFDNELSKKYTLSDITGKVLQKGTVNKHLTIDKKNGVKGFMVLTTTEGQTVSQVKLFIQ